MWKFLGGLVGGLVGYALFVLAGSLLGWVFPMDWGTALGLGMALFAIIGPIGGGIGLFLGVDWGAKRDEKAQFQSFEP